MFTASVSQLHGSFVYQFGAPEARLRPFLVAGLGPTFFSSHGLEGQTKLSWALGGGVKWFPRRGLGVRLQGKYNPTRLNDSSADFCGPFGFCQATLSQFEFLGGVVFRF